MSNNRDDTQGAQPSEEQRRRRCEQPPVLDEEDEAILDRTWDRIGAERRAKQERERREKK